VLESRQHLSIDSCYDSGPSSRPLREPLPRVYLPNLLDISFYGGVDHVHTEPFATISTWTMPRLRSLYFREFQDISTSPLLDFFKLLSTHGSQVQYLRLTCMYLQAQDISNLLTLCTDLRSLELGCEVSLFEVSASHARLEKIKAEHWPTPSPMSDSPMNLAVHPLKSLKLTAEKSFPKLVEAELIVHAFEVDGFHDATGSFRIGDTFITFYNGDKAYRLFDGETDFVGAYFGQAVDCADLDFGYLYLEVRTGSLTRHKLTEESV
jgi:hypothetical protein